MMSSYSSGGSTARSGWAGTRWSQPWRAYCADVEQTKPNPDLLQTAMRKAGSEDAVMIGDSVWDVEAAKRAGIETIAIRTGGFASTS